MAAGDVRNGPSAGETSAEVDVAAVFAELKEHVARGGAADDRAPLGRAAARRDAERLRAVAVDGPIERRRGLRGALVYAVKRVLRKLMSWYVGPFAADQRAFNAAVLRLLDRLSEANDDLRERLEHETAARGAREADVAGALDGLRAELDRLEGATTEVERLVRDSGGLFEELDERLLRLERRPRPSASPAGAAPPEPTPDVDYFAFETRMRGRVADIRERQRGYVDDFREHAPILDVGCGRGEFLTLLRDEGIAARGVDADSDMVAFCRGEGLEVDEGDAISYLAECGPGSLGGIFCAHVLEHLPTATILRLLELAKAALRPEGLFVAETPNPRTLIALSTFTADLTHRQPLHPEALSHVARQAGFRRVEVRYLNPPPAEGRLSQVPLPDAEELERARATLNANVDLLNGVVFGPQDYAVLARA